MWIVVENDPDRNGSYDRLPVVWGPFESSAEARTWIDDDDRFIVLER